MTLWNAIQQSDIQHNDIQQNEFHQNDFQQNDVQQNDCYDHYFKFRYNYILQNGIQHIDIL